MAKKPTTKKAKAKMAAKKVSRKKPTKKKTAKNPTTKVAPKKKSAKPTRKKGTPETQEKKPPGMTQTELTVENKIRRINEDLWKQGEAVGDDPQARKELPWGIGWPTYDAYSGTEKRYWVIEESEKYQFIGHDNIATLLRDHWINNAQEIEEGWERNIFDYYFANCHDLVKKRKNEKWSEILRESKHIIAKVEHKPLIPKDPSLEILYRLVIIEAYHEGYATYEPGEFQDILLGPITREENFVEFLNIWNDYGIIFRPRKHPAPPKTKGGKWTLPLNKYATYWKEDNKIKPREARIRFKEDEGWTYTEKEWARLSNRISQKRTWLKKHMTTTK